MTRKNSTPIPLAGLAGPVSFFSLRFCCFLQAGSLPAQADPSAGPGELVVRDSISGLMWQRGDSFHDLNKGLNWYEALEYAAKKNSEKFAGFDDWRLPNKAKRARTHLWPTPPDHSTVAARTHHLARKARSG